MSDHSPFDWNRLDERYRLILCDVWGVVHDGLALYPGVPERLAQWRAQGRTVIFVTNSPGTVEVVERRLDRVGLPRGHWDGVATAGEAGIAALQRIDQPVGLIGSRTDRRVLEAHGVTFADRGYSHLAVTGIDGLRGQAEDYRAECEAALADDATMHCLNPDRIVMVGGRHEVCAGAIADLYDAMGGKVEWYGKPDAAIYRYALELGGNPPPENVLAIGDSVATDMLGAAAMGFDAVFVAGGIHRDDPLPDYDSMPALGSWRPIATVDGLA